MSCLSKFVITTAEAARNSQAFPLWYSLALCKWQAKRIYETRMHAPFVFTWFMV